MIRKMRGVSRWTALPLVMLFTAACVRAQILEVREKDGRQIMCGTSGLFGFGSFCGLDNDFYSYIFLGTVLSVEPGGNNESRIRFHVDERFRGDPPAEVAAVTNQGECMPDFHPGDRWLAYLRYEKARGQVIAYENDSKLLKGAEAELDRLRLLAKLDHAGLVSGDVNMPPAEDQDWNKSAPVAHYEVTLTSKSDGRTYRIFTDENGRFAFDPLPAGEYLMNAATRQGIWTADEGSIEIKPHGCMRYNVDLRPDGLIAGRVTARDGKPMKNLLVKAVPVGNDGVRISGWTDNEGRFTLHGVWPGQYLVGFGGDPGSSADIDKLEVAFPGVRAMDKAIAVELGNAEHRGGINIVMPAP